MDVILGAWGLGADLGIPSRKESGLGNNVGIPPMSSRHAGCVEMFPFLLFDHVLMDERSYRSLVGHGIAGFSLSRHGKDILRELHRQQVLCTVDFTEVLKTEVARIQGKADSLLRDKNLARLLQQSRVMWSAFLTSPGGAFHPQREAERSGTMAEVLLLDSPLPKAEVSRRSEHDIYDVAAMVILAERLNAAICDWQTYRPFYDHILMAAVRRLACATPTDAERLHENLDLYIPVPEMPKPDGIFRIRESTVLNAFRRYLAFLDSTRGGYSTLDLLQLRRDLLSLDSGPISRVNVFPSLSHRPPAFSEEIVRQIVRSELERRFDRVERNPKSITQILQVIGGSINMGDRYSAGQAGAMGPGAHAQHVIFQQVWLQHASSMPLEQLDRELSGLRKHMREKASTLDHDVAIGAIAAAQKSAAEKDGPGVLENLSKAGKWALECAREIGIQVAATAIGKSLGL